MKKLMTKIIAIVLVIAISASMVVMSTSAYSAIAGIVDIVHILTDLKVTDGVIADITKLIGEAGIKSFIDTIKLISKAGIGIDDLVDLIHKITDDKVTDGPDFDGIADAIIDAATDKDILDKDAIIKFLKVIADLPLDTDTINAFIKGIIGSIDFGDLDTGKISKIFAVIIDAIKGSIGGGSTPDIDVPDIDIPDIDVPDTGDITDLLKKYDIQKLLDLINGLMNPNIAIDELEKLFKNLCPDIDLDPGFLNDLLDKIKGGNIDLPTLKVIFDKIGLPDIDNSLLLKILEFIKNGTTITLPDFGAIIGGIGDKGDIKDWLDKIFDKINGGSDKDDPSDKDPSTPSDPKDPSTPSDPKDPSDSKDPSTPAGTKDPVTDPKTDEVLEEVKIIDDLISNPENTPLGVTDPVPLDSIAQTSDAGIAAVASVTVLAAAAFVVAVKKKED